MGVPYEMRPDMAVTDIAFCILKNRGQAIHFKELIAEVMRVKAINQENPGRLIAQMHTEINLDSRFLHQGAGEWGLREWTVKGGKVVKIRPESSPAPGRSRAARRGEEDLDDEFEEEDDEFMEEEAEDDYDSSRGRYEDEDDED